METSHDFTEGKILSSLLRFALPVFLALFLQALYGGVDLLVVGQFAGTEDVSGVGSGSMLMQTVTMVITGFSMGITILVGQRIGAKRAEEAGRAVGTGICLFAVFAAIMTLVLVFGSDIIAGLLHAPKEAFEETSAYIRICGAGSFFIVGYNVLGAIFRGIGDSKMPLITVAIACVLNIAGDLLFVAVFHWDTEGAALATVMSQAVSVIISLFIIRKRRLPFTFTLRDIRFRASVIKTELKLGSPVALQEMLVGMSFLIIQAIVNTMGVIPSAGVGVAEKACSFLMLVPSAYMQSMSAFVAQNIGAEKPERAKRALGYGIATSLAAGTLLATLAFFFGNVLGAIFSKDPAVIEAANLYLRAYAIDCMIVSVLFCFIGYYNGCGRTLFVMVQGIVGAFFVRIPFAYLVSRLSGATLFHIGLATPASSTVQVILCLILFSRIRNKNVETVCEKK